MSFAEVYRCSFSESRHRTGGRSQTSDILHRRARCLNPVRAYLSRVACPQTMECLQPLGTPGVVLDQEYSPSQSHRSPQLTIPIQSTRPALVGPCPETQEGPESQLIRLTDEIRV